MLTVAEVALRLGCSEPRVRKWASSGELGAVLIAGRYLFDPADIEAFIDRHRITPRSERGLRPGEFTP